MAKGYGSPGASRRRGRRLAMCPALALVAAGLLFATPVDEMALSGLAVELGVSPSDRLHPPPEWAPGAPPLLSFRYFDASDRGRFGNLGLMTDDAGH